MSFLPINGATWQDLLTEIALARDERAKCIGSSYTAAAARDVQAKSFWEGMQKFCAYHGLQRYGWLNYDNPVTSGYWAFSESAFLAKLGGFRRAQTWDGVTMPSTDYGYMQAGDIIESWIFDDLQRALGLLRYLAYTTRILDVVAAQPATASSGIQLNGSFSGDTAGTEQWIGNNKLGEIGDYSTNWIHAPDSASGTFVSCGVIGADPRGSPFGLSCVASGLTARQTISIAAIIQEPSVIIRGVTSVSEFGNVVSSSVSYGNNQIKLSATLDPPTPGLSPYASVTVACYPTIEPVFTSK